MSPYKDPEKQRRVMKENMRNLRWRRKRYEIFGVAMETFLSMLEVMQIGKYSEPQYFKLFEFEGMKWFLPVHESPISEEIMLRQMYEILKTQYKFQGLPFVKSFEEFKSKSTMYKKRYKIKCVD